MTSSISHHIAESVPTPPSPAAEFNCATTATVERHRAALHQMDEGAAEYRAARIRHWDEVARKMDSRRGFGEVPLLSTAAFGCDKRVAPSAQKLMTQQCKPPRLRTCDSRNR